MNALEITSLTISGYAGKPVPNRLFRQTRGAQTLGVLYPGLHYTADMPLLYYTNALLRQRGYDVLQVNTDYTVPAYRALPAEERARWLAMDAQAAFQAGEAHRDYKRFLLVGKSIGTLALSHLVASRIAPEAITIWLTPLLRQTQLVAAARQCSRPALFVAGTADPNFDSDALASIVTTVHAELVLIEDADHSLEIPGNPFNSLEALVEIMKGIAEFLEQHAIRPGE